MGQSSWSCTYTILLTQDVKMEHNYTLWGAVSEIMGDFQNCHIWPWNLVIGQNSRSGTYTFFLTQGLEVELILALRTAVSEILADFQNFHIWAGIPEVAHICSLTTPRGWNWAYFCSTDSGFQDTGQFSKLPYLGMKLGKWPKFQKLHMYALSTPGGQNWAHICSMGSGFWDTGQYSNCNTCIWAWNLASGQGSRSCTS